MEHDNHIGDCMESPDQPRTFTTISLALHGSKRVYTYKCQLPVAKGDRVNVKLPRGHITTETVLEVHDTPQLSDKFELKWAVVVQTAAQVAEELESAHSTQSWLAKELKL